MSDDWRLRVDLHEDGPARALTEHLGESGLEHDLDTSFHDLVVVSREGAGVFCYTGTQQQAREAERLIHSLAARRGWHVDAELKRWHPSAEAWEDPDKPLPEADLERAVERDALSEHERKEVEERDRPQFEVRVQCRSHREALQFIERLRREELPSVRRSKYLLVGVFDEDSVHALAERLRREAPPGSIVAIEGSLQAASAGRPENPFAVLGLGQDLPG